MRKTLFRREAIQHQRNRLHGTVRINDPYSGLAGWIGALVIAACLLALLFAIPFSRKLSVRGLVAYRAGEAKLYAPQRGTVVGKHRQAGERVEKGDPIYTLSFEKVTPSHGNQFEVIGRTLAERTAKLQAEAANTRALHAEKRRSLLEQISRLRRRGELVAAQRRAQQERTSLLRAKLASAEELEREGYAPANAVRDRRGDMLDAAIKNDELVRAGEEVAAQIDAAESELRALATQERLDENAFDARIAEVKQGLVANDGDGQAAIVAPVAGVIANALAEPGESVDSRSLLATVAPADGTLEVHLYAAGTAVGFLSPGMSVGLKYDAFPYQAFGEHRGVIVEIGRTALSPAASAITPGAEPVYRVRVRLAQQGFTRGRLQSPLRSGMLVRATIALESRSLAEWLLSPIRTALDL